MREHGLLHRSRGFIAVGLSGLLALAGCGGPGKHPVTASTVLANGLTLTLTANRSETTTGNVTFTESYTNLTATPIQATVIGANLDPPHALSMDLLLDVTGAQVGEVASNGAPLLHTPPPVYTGIIQPGQSLSGTAIYSLPPDTYTAHAIFYSGTAYPYQTTPYDPVVINSVGDSSDLTNP